jgi:ribonuclease Z
MEKFEVHILGCGSALPTTRHFSSSQVVNIREKLFMIDCCEGAQLQLRRSHLKFAKLNHIFISHLHGDHCFGLPGLISTFGMLGRTSELHVYAPTGAESLFRPLLNFFCAHLSYTVTFHEFTTTAPQELFADRSVSVTTIPLSHRIPCCGFLLAEQPKQRHIIREMIDFYHVPVCEIARIKQGADFVADGKTIPNDRLTRAPEPSRRYAYCSDTAYDERIVEQIRDVDLLFHEATFAELDLPRALETNHSTARQAAQIALAAHAKRLLIGHFSARYDDETRLLNEAAAVFPDVQLARETLCVAV